MFEHLLSPVRIGGLELRNRIAMAPMGVEIVGADGRMSERMIRFYEERARGGTGLIISEVCAIAYPRGATTAHQLAISDDSYLPGLSELARRVHAHGARLAYQLVHHGKVSRLDLKEGRELLMPSEPRWHGAMDMARNAKRVFIVMEHTTSEGKPRLLKRCTLPLTCPGVVTRVFTDLGVFDFGDECFVMKEVAPGWTVEEVQAVSEASIVPAPDLHEVGVEA